MGPIGQLSVKSSSPIIITHKVITTQSCCFIGDPREGAGGGGKDRGGDEGDHHGDGIQPHTPTVHRDAQVTANLVIFILINCSKIFVTAADTVLYFLNVSPEEKIRKKFLPVAIFFLCSRGRTICIYICIYSLFFACCIFLDNPRVPLSILPVFNYCFFSPANFPQPQKPDSNQK